MELSFDDLDISDQVFIRTQNSEYRFLVSSPAERKGQLSGGSLGNETRDAVLVGTLTGVGEFINSDSSMLRPGLRALFYLTANSGVERLITSNITEISHLKSRDKKRAA